MMRLVVGGVVGMLVAMTLLVVLGLLVTLPPGWSFLVGLSAGMAFTNIGMYVAVMTEE